MGEESGSAVVAFPSGPVALCRTPVISTGAWLSILALLRRADEGGVGTVTRTSSRSVLTFILSLPRAPLRPYAWVARSGAVRDGHVCRLRRVPFVASIVA